MRPLRSPPADAILPHLSTVVDAAAMAPRLGRLLPLHAGAPVDVRACEVERIKYRPGRNCVVGYRLQVEIEGRPSERRFNATVYAAAEAVARHDKACADGAPGAAHLLDDLDAVVRVFPHDRKLPHLALLADGELMVGHFLPPLVASRWGSRRPAGAATHAVIGYFPEHTCTVVLQARLDAPAMHWRAFGKTRYDDAGAQTHRAMSALWSSDAHRHGAVGYARPLGYDARHRLLWQEGVPAPTLHALLATGPVGPAVLRRVAHAVAALHGTRHVPTTRQVSLADLLAALDHAESLVSRALPRLAGHVRAIVQDLRRRSRDLDDTTRGTLHGDLHSKNILIAPDRACLIDLDRLSHGLPLSEVGSLLAELAARDCAAHGHVHHGALEQLVDCYREESSFDAPRDAVDWHFAAALITERAGRAITSLKPGWATLVPSVIDVARSVLARSPGRTDAGSLPGATP